MQWPRTVSYALQEPFHPLIHIPEGRDMVRTREFCCRLAAIACALGLAAADVTLAGRASSPESAALVRTRTRTHAGAVAPRPGAAGLPRPASVPTASARPTSSPSVASAPEGLVLEGDPPTAGPRGTLQTTPDPSITRSTDGLVIQVLPNGSRRVNLQGRFRAYSAVAIAADGALRMACADDQAAALAIAAAAAHAPATRAHRVAFGPGEE